MDEELENIIKKVEKGEKVVKPDFEMLRVYWSNEKDTLRVVNECATQFPDWLLQRYHSVIAILQTELAMELIKRRKK